MARPGNGGTFMSGCTGCGGCASGCGGCQSQVLILTEAEFRLLRRFGELALLPAAGQEALDSLNIQGCGE